MDARFAMELGVLRDGVPANIAVLDKDGNIVDVNDPWVRFGTENKAASLGAISQVNYLRVCEDAEGVDAEYAPAVLNGLRAVLSGSSEGFSMDYPCHAPDAKRWFRLVAFPLPPRGEGGAVVMHVPLADVVNAFKEVARVSKEAAEQRERAADLQRRLNALAAEGGAQTNFVNQISHELRTPLNTIMGYTQLLEATSAEMQNLNMLNEIKSAGSALLRLVDELLELNRFDSTAVPSEFEPVGLGEAITECLGIARQMVNQFGYEVQIPQVPTGQDVFLPVVASPRHLRQVLLNSMSTLVKTCGDNSLLDVSYRRLSNSHARLRLAMTSEDKALRSTFDATQQPLPEMALALDSQLGVGLVFSKHLVELMAGRFVVEESSSGGTIIWIDLPLALEGTESIQAAHSAA